MIENLNKENFWDDLQKSFPEAINHFSNWINGYKKEVGWDELFGNVFPTNKKIKFHDIPLELQVGIIARYEMEMKINGEELYSDVAAQYKEQVHNLFMKLQRKLLIKTTAVGRH